LGFSFPSFDREPGHAPSDVSALTKNPDRFGWLDAFQGGSGWTSKVDIRIAAEVPGTSDGFR
jgi:hypothetical protein